MSFSTPNGPYTPHNYEGDYKGTITLLNAFAESRNIPALKLADKVGIGTVIATAHRFGVTSNIPAFLPVAIGAADISLIEQVGAYSVFPNDGIRIEPHTIRRVVRADGLPMEEPPPQVVEVISVETARTMMQFLQAVTQHGTGAAAASLKHPAGRQDGDDQRLYGRVVHRVFAVGDLRDVDRLRRPADAGREGDRSAGGAADVDGLHAGGDCQ